MQKPTLPIAVATIIALASILVAALQTTTIFPSPSTGDDRRGANARHHEAGTPRHGHGHHPFRRHEPKPNDNSPTSSNTAETNPFPPPHPIPPVLRFDLSSTSTINLSPYLPKAMTNGSNIPVVLDTLSICSWLATADMRCADFDSLSTGSTASTTNTSTTNDSNHRDNSTTAGRCVQSIHDGDFVPAVTSPLESHAATGERTTVRRTRRRCSHYLAGEVSGTVAAVPLRLSSAMLAGSDGGGAGSESSSSPSSESAAVIPDARDDEVGVDVVLATTFSAGPGLLFGDFQRCYGGGSGVVGLGLGLSVNASQQSGNSISDPVIGADNDDENRSMTSQGVLASIFSSWSWHHVDTKRRFGLALPRDGEVGVFTIGGSVRDLVIDGPEASVTLAEEVVLAMSITADGAETAAVGRSSAGPGFGALYSIDVANITFQASDSASSQASADVPGDVFDGGDGETRERYYIDTALPVIWTSESIAAAIAAQFDPPGWFEPTTSAATNSSSTNSTAESRQTNASSSWTNDLDLNSSGTTTISNNTPPPPPQQHRPGLLRVSCNATAPNTTLHLDGGTSRVSVPIYPPDMVVRMRLRTDEGRKCMSAFQSGDVVSAPHGGGGHGGGERKVQVKLRRLGWPFLRNVLLDFDLGAGAGAGAGAAAGGGGGRVGVGIRTWPPDAVAVDAAGREDGHETGTGNWNGNRTRVSTRGQTSATTATATATSTTMAVPSTSTSKSTPSTLVTSTRTLRTNDTGAAPPGEGHEIQPSLTLTLTSASMSASTSIASPSSPSPSPSPEGNTFTASDSSSSSSSSSPLPNITFPTTAAIQPGSGGEPQQPRPRPNHPSDPPENENLAPR